MSENKEKIEELTKRVDELVLILNGMVQDLKEITASLRSLAVSQITQSATSAIPSAPPIPLPQPTMKSKAVEDIKMMLPEELESLLSFEEKEDYIMIKPQKFLGSDNFSKIASIIRGAGGDYVSAGKASHFRVPKGRN